MDPPDALVRAYKLGEFMRYVDARELAPDMDWADLPIAPMRSGLVADPRAGDLAGRRR